MNALPSSVIESSHGMVLIILLWMIGFAALYLYDKWREIGSIGGVYRECKPAVALLLMFSGFAIRTFILWWFLHMQNHGIDPRVYRDVGLMTFVICSVMVILGGICWTRVITPRNFHRMTWMIVAGVAIAFGIGMAL